MKIFIAGSNTRNCADHCRTYGLPKLYSFLNEKRLISEWEDDHLLMVDSGAHSWNKETITKVGMKKKTKLKDADDFIKVYYRFILEHAHKKLIFVEYDVYGHLPTPLIDRFYSSFQKLGAQAKMIRVYHPMLDGGTLDVLRKWIDEGHDYIGVGNDSTQMLGKIFDLTRDTIRLHGFAMTKIELLEQYPFFSADSTSPIATVIFGTYSKPIMSKKLKPHVMDEKSIECFHDDWERLENAVIECSRAQDYLTELWKIKGVTWKELNWLS